MGADVTSKNICRPHHPQVGPEQVLMEKRTLVDSMALPFAQKLYSEGEGHVAGCGQEQK